MRELEDTPQNEGEQEDDELDDGPSSLETVKLVLEIIAAIARLLGLL